MEKTIVLESDIVLTAYYEEAELPPTPPIAIIPVITATVGLILTGIAIS